MKVLEGEPLAEALRAAVDSAEKRLWIASPYIGGWPNNVRCILGSHWQKNVADVRLLTDVDERGFRLNTLQQFFRRGEVKTLRGLHAKLYIADDFVLVTSANLTGMAFSRRYETGITLSGNAATAAVRLFERWWKLPKAKAMSEDQLPTPKGGGPDPDHPGGPPLPVRNELPPDPEDEPLPPNYGDYTVFLEAFGDLAGKYRRVQRIWPQAPLNFEVDGFLSYLYFHAPGVPSRPYRKKKPRTLTPAEQESKIAGYAKQFAHAYRQGEAGDETASWRSERARAVRTSLGKNLKRGLNRNEIEELLLQLNATHFYRMNLRKVLNPANNRLKDIQETLTHLTDEGLPIQRRMSDSTGQVLGLGKAAIQELVGFYSNGKYPLRNANTNCGLRFFGYDVRVD